MLLIFFINLIKILKSLIDVNSIVTPKRIEESKFTGVFHETLPGLPPEQEVDLCIINKQRMEQLA